MKLCYRDVNDKDTPTPLEMTEREISARFRGEFSQFPYVRHIPEPLGMHTRKFCGVAAATPQPVVVKTIQVAQPVVDASPSPFHSRNQLEILDQLFHTHLKNIQRTLEHRLQVARAKGDQKLVQLLETESQQMACPLG